MRSIELIEWIDKYKPVLNEKYYFPELKNTILDKYIWAIDEYFIVFPALTHRKLWSVEKIKNKNQNQIIYTIKPGLYKGIDYIGYFVTECPYINNKREVTYIIKDE